MASLLTLSTTALFANNAQLQTIGNNIANANTPGYSRQQVEVANEQGQYTGAGFFGRGVKVVTVSRAENTFLTRAAQAGTAQASADQTRLEQLQRLENLFPTGDTGIGAAATSLFNAFTDVANSPQDLSARQVVLSNARELSARIRSAGEQIDVLQQGVVSDLRTDAATVNQLATQVARLNDQIAAFRGSGQPPNDLLDQRDQLVNQINEYVQVSTLADDDGTLSLFVGGGQTLVLGAQANSVAITDDTFDPTMGRLSIVIEGQPRELSTDSIGGGSIAGLLRFQDEDLVDARNLLGQMAAAVTQRVNEQQSYGLDLNNVSLPVASRSGGGPIFATTGPRAMGAATNAASDTSVTVAVADATQLQASSYELYFDGTDFRLTRLGGPAGYQQTTITAGQMASGYTIDGMTLGPMTGTAPTLGDRIRIEPVGQSAAYMQTVMADPKGIAAASPMAATTAASNTGTLAVAGLEVSAAPTTTPYAGYYAYFSSSSGGSTADQYQLFDASSPPPAFGVPLGPVTTLSSATPISYNGIDLSFTGVPRAGDQIDVAPTTFAASNNGNAKALLALRDDGMVGRAYDGTGTLQPGGTMAQAWASALADIGVRVQGAEATAEISQNIVDEAQQQLLNETGVNLDEEAARLIQFQQSYQAAAKILQVSQTIFDSLLSVAGR